MMTTGSISRSRARWFAGVVFATAAIVGLAGCSVPSQHDTDVAAAFAKELDLGHYGRVAYTGYLHKSVFSTVHPEVQQLVKTPQTKVSSRLRARLARLGFRSIGENYWQGRYGGEQLTLLIAYIHKGEDVSEVGAQAEQASTGTQEFLVIDVGAAR